MAVKLQTARQLHSSGRLAMAQAAFEEILAMDSAHFEAMHGMGIIAGQTKDWGRAAELIGRALEINPHSAAAYSDRGVALKALNQWHAALASFNQAIAVNALHAEAYCNRGNLLRELGDSDGALRDYNLAIAIKSNYAGAYYNRGVLLQELGQLPAALDSYERAIISHRAYAKAYCNRGVVLECLHRFDAALASYDQAIAIESEFAQAHSNRGNVLRALGRVEEAIASCDRAIAIEPGYAAAYQNRAVASLLAGRLQQGWRDFEWRWRNESSALVKEKREFLQPLWQGQSLAGKTILLHSEQGLGDTIQFCRYAALLDERGGGVILEVQPALLTLLAGLNGVQQLIARGSTVPHTDYHCPLLSLPLGFDTTLATIPAQIPYLRSNAQKASYWREKLGDRLKLRVGLVWSGGFRPHQPELRSINERRNIPLAKLASLARSDIEFYSLQKGEPAQSEWAELAANHWDGPRLIDFTPLLHDFSDTAALIENLDLVISVDTSTAHLAGALGKPVWILNRFDSCWRWLLDRSDSPWYPTVRLYRQPSAGDWDSVVQRIRDDLAQLLT